MSARLRRTVVALALAPWMAFSLAIPPEHVHEVDADHPHSVTHRHFEAHDHDGAEIEHGDGRIVWLDNDLALQQPTYQLAVAPVVVPAHSRTVQDFDSWIVQSILDASPPHGPPRPSISLRAPPSLSA